MLYTFDQLSQYPQNASQDMPAIGKKAASLIQLKAYGAPVPDGASLSIEALELFLEPLKSQQAEFFTGQLSREDWLALMQKQNLPTELAEQLQEFLAEHPDTHWAVRSSGIQEDLADASFAGLYTSVLNVLGLDAVIRALKTCWASLYSETVQTYAERQGFRLDQMQMGVVIQRMIPAQKSGVLFTVHPLQGQDTQMLIEAVPGLGEALVSGHATPDSYIYDWKSQQIIESHNRPQERCLYAIPEAPFTAWQDMSPEQAENQVLSEAQIIELCQLALKMQAAYGFPLDIEWCYADGQFYLVQSRPITQLAYQGIAGEWTTADFKDGGVSSDVCTPLMWSLYDSIWERTMPTYLQKTHLMAAEVADSQWGDMFFGRPYWNVGAVKAGLKQLPGFVEREFDEDIGIEVTYEGDGHVAPNNLRTLSHGLKVLSALKRAFKQRLDFNPGFARRQRQRLAELAAIDLSPLGKTDLFNAYENLLLEDYFQCESAYFYHIFDNSNVTTLFKDSFKPYQLKTKYLSLISGLSDLSHLRQNHGLWRLSRLVRGQPNYLNYWQDQSIEQILSDWEQQQPAPLFNKLRAYIQEFGYHSTRELDITVPRYSEDPRFVFESLKSLLKMDDSFDPKLVNAKQHQEYLLALEKLLAAAPIYKRSKLAKQMEQVRQFLWWREELRDLSTQMYAEVRRWTLVVAERLVAQKSLKTVESIFFLTLHQILDLCHEKLSVDAAAKIIAQEQAYYASFKHFSNPNELGERYTGQSKPAVTGDVLSGISGSAGQVTGRARVIRDIHDADRLETGDILITRFTDPGWTPKFGMLAGVATETGGQLSHAAVISREYGIPAVLAVKGLTQRVVDGQQITIDGDRGQVILSESSEAESSEETKA